MGTLVFAASENATELGIKLEGNAVVYLGIALGLYLIGLFAVSIYASRKVSTEEDYLVAGRKLPLFLAWGTLLATWYGAASMMGASQAARDEGLRGVILDPFACAATLVFAGLVFARPLWRMKLLTMGDFFREKYGMQAEVTACCIQVPSYFGWIAAQYIALGAVQEAYFGVPLWLGILIGAGVTLTYTMIGGMWSVTLTDTAQIVIALLGLVVLTYSSFQHLGNGSFEAGVNALLEYSRAEPEKFTLWPKHGAAPLLVWIGAWATGLFGNIPGQDLNQRVFASKDEKTASQACILAGVLYLVFGVLPVTLGLMSNITDPQDIQDKILPVMAGKYLSPVMAVVFTVSFVSIVVSTATSAVLAPATILGHNLLGRFNMFHGRGLFLDRLCVLLISLGGLAMAFSGESIMGLLDIQLSLAMVALFVPLAMGIYGRPRGQLAATLSMAFGAGLWLLRFVFEKIVAMPDDSGFEEYADFVAHRFSPEQYGSFVNTLAYVFALIPADLYGLAAAFGGYFLGQWWLGRRSAGDRPAAP
jgi:solute:Na+ symporter, SSS family